MRCIKKTLSQIHLNLTWYSEYSGCKIQNSNIPPFPSWFQTVKLAEKLLHLSGNTTFSTNAQVLTLHLFLYNTYRIMIWGKIQFLFCGQHISLHRHGSRLLCRIYLPLQNFKWDYGSNITSFEAQFNHKHESSDYENCTNSIRDNSIRKPDQIIN